MKPLHIVANHRHAEHAGRQEMHRGRLVPCVEVPARQDLVAQALGERGFALNAPEPEIAAHTHALLPRLHDADYLSFLASAWSRWCALSAGQAGGDDREHGPQQDLLPDVWPTRGMRQDRLPDNFAAQVGYFAFDSGSPITAGTWDAAFEGACCAVSAARAVSRGDAAAALALTRPPGHHAGPNFFGGYCFLNNGALAAQTLRDEGFDRVAILDIDYHHGNGTQAIFEQRADVLTLSLHGDPQTEYPFFLGHADELGSGAGLGANRNWPLPRGTGFTAWRQALLEAVAVLREWGAQALVVPMGLDTFQDDPISGFTLTSSDFDTVGADLATLRLPTVFTLEGGYATAAIGDNAARLLSAFVANGANPTL